MVLLTFSPEEPDEEELADFLNPEELFCECKQVQFFFPPVLHFISDVSAWPENQNLNTWSNCMVIRLLPSSIAPVSRAGVLADNWET